MSTIYTDKEQCHFRFRTSRLTLKEHSLSMLTFRTFLICTRLHSALILQEKEKGHTKVGSLATSLVTPAVSFAAFSKSFLYTSGLDAISE